MKIWMLLILGGIGGIPNAAPAQNPPLLKSAYAGSYMVVPAGKYWTIDRVFVNEGGSYNIKIGNGNFRETYKSGDTLRVPYYVAEMELLSENATAIYQFYISETDSVSATPK